ncbi:MAG: hypothetical protein PHC38_03045 [Weeksellaceae bacterium]|nr:hypothetical protein [Weeksellaceae bacterium]
MNTGKKEIFSMIIGFLILLAIGFFVYKLTIIIIEKADKLDANIIVAILAGAFTIIGFYITRFLEKKKLIEQQIREQKLPIYEEFIDFIFKVFENTKENSKEHVSEAEMQKFFWKLNRKSILWLSDNTLKSYITWRNGIEDFAKNNPDNKKAGAYILLDFERLLLDFRKDIGHKNANIKQGDIILMFVNDWKQHIETKK